MIGQWLHGRRVRLEILQKTAGRPSPASEEPGATECNRCGHCCHESPPVLEPDDLRRLAARFVMTPREFVKRYCVMEPEYEKYPVYLSRHGWDEYLGEVVPDDETWSSEPCIMFDKEAWGCSVHDDKPRGCREYGCWIDGGKPVKLRPWTSLELKELLP
jgi:Fe-S-cluster containining protein